MVLVENVGWHPHASLHFRPKDIARHWPLDDCYRVALQRQPIVHY
jgi:hypothetical protein